MCLVSTNLSVTLSVCRRQDEDSLNNKLCTFTTTQKEYVPQHWYHCHTCGMLDSVGVCTVCVRVCHKGHDVTYAKNGSFFCDCGAKEDNSCQVRRHCLRLGGAPPGDGSGSDADRRVPVVARTGRPRHQMLPVLLVCGGKCTAVCLIISAQPFLPASSVCLPTQGPPGIYNQLNLPCSTSCVISSVCAQALSPVLV